MMFCFISYVQIAFEVLYTGKLKMFMIFFYLLQRKLISMLYSETVWYTDTKSLQMVILRSTIILVQNSGWFQLLTQFHILCE